MDATRIPPLIDSQGRQLDELQWLLLPHSEAGAWATAEHLPVATPAPALLTERPLLVVLHTDGQRLRLSRLLLFTTPAQTQRLAALASNGEDCEAHHDADCDTLMLSASPSDPEDALHAAVGRLFAALLISSRPLRRYDCSLLLPLDLRLDAQLQRQAGDIPELLQPRRQGNIERYRVKRLPSLLAARDDGRLSEDDRLHAQAYEYFSTHLRDQLFDREPPDRSTAPADNTTADDCPMRPLRHWRIRPTVLTDWRLELDGDGRDSDGDAVTSAALRDVSLFQYYNGLLLLALRVTLPDRDTAVADPPDDAGWWWPLLFGDEQDFEHCRRRQCDRWLRFTKLARVLFADFLQQLDEHKVAGLRLRCGASAPANMTPDSGFSEPVQFLLRQFLPELPAADLSRERRLHQVDDARMFVNVAYALAGPPPARDQQDDLQRLFSYALYVDQRSDGCCPGGWAYDADYSRELMQAQVLRRWASSGSLFGYTEYSSVALGFGDFFSEVIAAGHVPYLYNRMQLTALLYRSSLALFDRRITAATNDLRARRSHSPMFRELRSDFIEFTNNYWFRQLSPQTQGREICDRMMQAQRLEPRYEVIKDQMERADEYAASLRDHWLQKRAESVGWIAALLAVGTLLVPPLGESFGWPRWASGLAAAGLLVSMTPFILRLLRPGRSATATDTKPDA